MDLTQIFLLAIGLSMDSLAIALTSGAIIKNHKIVNILKIAGMLAFMQMSLTIFGWTIGATFANYIHKYDHWFAFIILLVLGVRVIFESIKGKDDSDFTFNPLNIKVMFGLAVATSIDATAVGLSLSLVNSPIVLPAIIIGVVTFLISSLGIIFGCKAGQKFNIQINIAGGIILILIGSSILIEHTILASNTVAGF